MSTGTESYDIPGKWEFPSKPDVIPKENRFTGDTNSYGNASAGPVDVIEPNFRTARLSTDNDGEPLAAVMVISPDDLDKMGIDSDNTESIIYGFVNGELVLYPETDDGGI